MIVENINGNPTLEFLENDEKFLAKMSKGKVTVFISKPVKNTLSSGKVYRMFIDDQEIYGTGTDSLAAAISWAENYIMLGERNPKETVLQHLREINRTLALLEICFENDKVKLKR